MNNKSDYIYLVNKVFYWDLFLSQGIVENSCLGLLNDSKDDFYILFILLF